MPFITVDLVRRSDGAWRVVEVGDGQVSDRPATATAGASRLPGTLAANAPRQRRPGTRGQRRPAVGASGAHRPRAGVTVPGARYPVGPGHPARLWPPSPQLAGHANIRHAAADPAEPAL